MTINTSRFGEITIQKDDMVTFTEGLLGFGHLSRFVLLDDPNDEIFAWLQSCENPEIAFPVLEPELFMQNYTIEPMKSDLDALGITKAIEANYLTVVTIPNDPTLMTANLKAPILINRKTKIARQCVLQDNNLPIREPIFQKLQSRVVQNPDLSLKANAVALGAVKLPSKTPEAEA